MAINIGTGPQDIPLNQFLGEMAFMDVNPRVVMLAQKNTGATFNSTTVTKTQFPNTVVDTHIGLSNTNSRYTIPFSGDYMVMFNLNLLASSNNSRVEVRVNENLYSNYQISHTNHPRLNFHFSGIIPNMVAGDYIEICGRTNTGSVTVDNAGNWMIYKM